MKNCPKCGCDLGKYENDEEMELGSEDADIKLELLEELKDLLGSSMFSNKKPKEQVTIEMMELKPLKPKRKDEEDEDEEDMY